MIVKSCQLLSEGREVVVDQRNTTASDRAAWVALGQQAQGAISVSACTMHRAIHICASNLQKSSPAMKQAQMLANLDRCGL